MDTLAVTNPTTLNQLNFQFFSDEDSRVHSISESLIPHIAFALQNGRNQLDELLHLSSKASSLLRFATQSRQPVHFRASLRKEAGILLPANWTILPQAEGYQWIGFPITDENETENRLHEIERTLSSLHDIVFELDATGRFTNFWVQDVEALYLSPSNFLGLTVDVVLKQFPAPANESLLSGYQEALASENKIAVEYQLPDNFHWYNARFMPVRHADASFAGMIIVLTDITLQKELEHNLRESEEKYRDLFENANDIVYIVDLNMNIRSINQKALELLEYNEQELIGKPSQQLVAPEKITPMQLQYESEFISKSGNRIPVDISARLIFKAGEPDGMHITARDIRNQKLAAIQLAKSEAKFRFLAENSRDLICLHRPNGDYIYISPSVQNMLGYSRDELIGKSPYDYFYSDDFASVVRSAQSTNFFGMEAPSIQYRFRKKDNSYVWLESVSKPIMEEGELIYIQTNSRDITERKNAEEKLRHSEEWFKTLFQNSLDIVLVVSTEGLLMNASPSFENQLGYNMDAWLNHSVKELVHPDQVNLFEFAINKVIAGKQQDLVIRIRLKHCNNTWLWMELKAASGLTSPNIHGIILSLRNITEYIEIEKTLQHYSDRITGMLHSITDGFIAVDKTFAITMFNSVAQDALHFNNNLEIGLNIWNLFPDSKDSISFDSLQTAMKQESTIRYEQHIAVINRWFDVSAFPYEEGLFIYFKDVSARKKQERLLQLEKKVLEMHTSSQASLQQITNHLLVGVELLSNRFLCAVCMIKNNLRTPILLAAPSMPPLFWEFTESTPLDPEFTTCGRAILQKQAVIIPNVEASDLAESTKKGAEALGIKATMSIPMISSGNEVLGTLALYFLDARKPTDEEMAILSRLTHLLTMILENKQAAEKLWISNERYLLATKASNEAIWDWDAIEQVTFWGEGFNTLFGYPSMFYTGSSMNWENKIHPNDQERVIKLIGKYTAGEKKGLYKTEYRFMRADDTYATVIDKGYCIYDDKGRVIRMIGSTEDITERKLLEEKLLQQEIHKQQQIAQAVVDVQENERAEIGKELHDNVNQLLTTAKLFLELVRNDDSMRESMLKRSSDTIMNAINEIRKISRSLMPASISDLGLVSSISDVIENINLSRQLYAEFKYDKNLEKRLKAKEKLMFFRIIQEQVNNVLKHSQASNLLISISNHRKITRLEIKDNGNGFDMQQVRKKEGIGMLNIMSRAAIFNAQVEIIAAPGKGCHLVIDLPYSSKKTLSE